MDWAIVLSMPLMLLLGFIGDAISREEDDGQGLEQAEAGTAEAGPEAGVAEAGDGLSAMMAASAPEEEPAELVEADDEGELPEQKAAEAAPEALDEPEADGDGDEDIAEEAGAEEEAPAEEAVAEEDGPEEVEDFDPEEDVLVVEAEGASEAEPEFEATEDGLFVRMAGQEAFLPGVTELPADAVVGVEPSPST